MRSADPAYWTFIARVACVVAGFSTCIGVAVGESHLVAEGRPGPASLAILAHSCLWLAWRSYAAARAGETQRAEAP